LKLVISKNISHTKESVKNNSNKEGNFECRKSIAKKLINYMFTKSHKRFRFLLPCNRFSQTTNTFFGDSEKLLNTFLSFYDVTPLKKKLEKRAFFAQ